ncbi:MAG TPA: hypothetical protein VG498_02155 [Terriglobales bacterium]|nr:hypothetical protein [Terriglobales bacterium]
MLLSKKSAGIAVVLVSLLLAPCAALGQVSAAEPRPVPVLSGSMGFVPIVQGGQTTLVSTVSPVLLAPIGDKWLVESRGAFEGDFARPNPNAGYAGKVNKEVEYLQLDYIANRYVTITAGRFLNPFGIYNERLYPVWIRNLQTDPLILPLEEDSRNGLMLRGGVVLNSNLSLNYTTFFSVQDSTNKLESERVLGGRVGAFFPKQRLEVGATLQHTLVEDHSNRFGLHFEQQPLSIPLDVRAEYAHSLEGSGWWIEPAYKLSQVKLLNGIMRKAQLVSRFQQFYVGNGQDDDLPSADTKMFEAGVNYYIFDGFKATASYGRQFSSASNQNVWTIGLAYRWVLPLGRGGTL